MIEVVTAEERALVLARLTNLPPHMKLSIGNQKALSKEELIEHIQNCDPIGDKFVEIQLTYLRGIAKEYS